MAYGYNENIYTTLKKVEVMDVFDGERLYIDAGTDIDSSLAHWLIVDADERESFEGLTPNECIDKKIELGYIELKV